MASHQNKDNSSNNSEDFSSDFVFEYLDEGFKGEAMTFDEVWMVAGTGTSCGGGGCGGGGTASGGQPGDSSCEGGCGGGCGCK